MSLSHFIEVRRDSASPWPGPRGEVVRLSSEAVELTVRPDDGCRLESLRLAGVELLRQWTPERRAFQYGSFPMVPWVGRMAGGVLRWGGEIHQLPVNRPPHALHGVACFGPWENLGDGRFRLDLGQWWPWEAEAVQEFRVSDTTVTMALEIRSGGASFPAQAGWHPWFLKEIAGGSHPAELTWSPSWQEELDAEAIPTGRRIPVQDGPWDNSFGFEGPGMAARLDWGTVSIDITGDHPWMTVFDMPEDAICVEPLSGPPNGVNTCPRVVSPDAPLRLVSEWRLRSEG